MAWAFIGSASANGPSGAITTTGASTLTSDFILIGAHAFGQPVPTPTDSVGITWTPLTTQYESVNSYAIKFFYADSGSTGWGTNASHTFTVTTTVSALFLVVNVFWFSGWSAFDAESGAIATSSPKAPGSITPADSDELFISGATHNVGSNATVDSSFSTPIGAGQSGGNNVGGNLAYKIKVASAAAENPTWTAGGAVTMAVALAAFRTAGGGAAFLARRGLQLNQSVNRASTY